MLYLIGLGLNLNGISKEGLEIAKRCKKVYLENYTVDFPYTEGELSEKLGLKKIFSADREKIENFELVDEAKRNDVAILVYGSPLTATTHISLVTEAKECRVKCKIIHSASILDAVARTGLQLYKFGKITSMPAWKKSFEPTSFMEIVKENQSINAHSLILADIGLDFQDALEQLKKSAEEHKIKLSKILVCQQLGTSKEKIFYMSMEELEEYSDIRKPYCLIIPGKLHFVEQEFLKRFER
ncbi:MAG: diphthine synthase [Nanoarchaeota archaeon]|nr:diphthine synthase [Nanoarchaeota archaeon]